MGTMNGIPGSGIALHRPSHRILSQRGQSPEAYVSRVAMQLFDDLAIDAAAGVSIQRFEIPQSVIRDLLHGPGIPVEAPEFRRAGCSTVWYADT